MFLPVLASILQGCEECGGRWLYQAQSLATKTMKIEELGKEQLPYKFTSYYSPDTVKFNKLCLKLTSLQERIAVRKEYIIGNAAFACDPTLIDDEITRVWLTSDQNYNKEYPVGKDLFAILDIYEKEVRKEGFYLVKRTGLEMVQNFNELYFAFQVLPDPDFIVHKFTFRVQYQSGIELAVTTQGVLISK